ncbi:MAG: long-chain-fatty-acid--CoA ligase [Candidatus Saccharibacteria bacterium]
MERIWYNWYDSKVPRSIDYPGKPVKDYFREWAEKQPEKPYLIYNDLVITYQQANSMARKLANSLIELGVKKGDRVAIMTINIPQYVIALQACFKAGFIVVPANPLYTPKELTHQFNDSGAENVFVMSFFADKIHQIMDSGATSLKRAIIIQNPVALIDIKSAPNIYDFDALIASGQDSEPWVDIYPDDIALLQYTGGTTGPSKGCILSNRNLEAIGLQTVNWFNNLFPDWDFRNLGAIPFHHIYGFNTNINMNSIAGGTIIIVDIPTPDNLLKNINQHSPNFFTAVPAMIYGLNQHPDISTSQIKSIKGMICGSAPLAVEVMKHFEELSGATITEGYGMSESSNVLTCTPIFTKRIPGSVGLPWPDMDIRIVDLETGNHDLPPGEPGELIARGPTIMQGYWNNPQETANTIRNGWLYTGDIATMDEEGYIKIIDRKKDMIICSGFNVYPRDIDEVMYGHPKVLDACTIGIPDPRRGESVKVYLVLKPGESMTEDEVKKHCRESLAPYKVPTYVEFINELPRTPVGKPMRTALRAMEKAKARGEDFRA